MKGRRFTCAAPRRIEVEEFEMGSPGPHEVLIENQLTAVSTGTEIYNWLHGSEPGSAARFPRPTGYCSTGTVLEVGEGVEGLLPGDRVVAQESHASHSVASRYVFPMPDGVEWEDAAFLTMAAISMHGLRRAQVELGSAVAVIGLGLVGQLAASLCKLAGALPLIAIDLDSKRLSHAQTRGVDATIIPTDEEDTVARVRDLCVSDGADVVVEATGKPDVYPLATRLARTAGRVIGLGSPRGSVDMDFMRDVHLREVDVLGAIQPITPETDHIYYPWTKGRDRQLLLELMARGRLTVRDLITHRAQPEACQNIYDMLADRPAEAIGVVFEWR